jgi:hypothetical protein
MKDEVLAHLHDIVEAAKAVKRFVAGRTFEHYASDEQLRSPWSGSSRSWAKH